MLLGLSKKTSVGGLPIIWICCISHELILLTAVWDHNPAWGIFQCGSSQILSGLLGRQGYMMISFVQEKITDAAADATSCWTWWNIEHEGCGGAYFWNSNLDKQIEEIAKSFSSLQKVWHNPPTHQPWEFPQKPWHHVDITFAGPVKDQMFFLIVLYMSSTTTDKTIDPLQRFSHHPWSFERLGYKGHRPKSREPVFTPV